MLTRSMRKQNTRSAKLFALAIMTVLACSYGIEKQIEINQNMVEIDYN